MHPNGIDPDATRRTFRPPSTDSGDAPTRRTATIPRAAAKSVFAPRKLITLSERRRRFLIQVLFFGLIALGFWNEWWVWRSGSNLKRDLEAERLKDYDQAWTQYQGLLKRSYLPTLLSGPRSALKDRLVRSADRVISEYRDIESNIVKESDWQRTRVILARALELDPGEKQIRGRLRLAEGHISRINAGGSNQGQSWNNAKAYFEEAKELMRNSPDPHLGLARLYIYAFQDTEKAEKELSDAERKGYRPGKREKFYLADGYRMQGDRWRSEAARASGQPEEGEYLQRADESYARAEDYYDQAVPFGNSSAMLRHTHLSRGVVAIRFENMRQRR
jgi:hypothetical protein